MMRNKYTDETIARARELHGNGTSCARISKEMGVPYSVMHRWLNESSRKRAKAYRDEHRDERRKYNRKYDAEHKNERRAYIEDNREALAESRKRWADANQGKIRDDRRTYYKKNRTKAIRDAIRWNKQNPGAHHEAQRKWREANRDKVFAAGESWRAKNPARARAIVARRLARRRDATPDLTEQQKAEIESIYDASVNKERVRCYICGEPVRKGHRHVDHIIPLARGGLHVPSNLAIACDSCNWGKGSKLPEEIGLLIRESDQK